MGEGEKNRVAAEDAAKRDAGRKTDTDADDGEIPEGFTLGLAVIDGIPVLLFCASMVVVATRFGSALFVIGAICSALAGCGKVLWKVLMAVARKDVSWLAWQFRYLMSAGFILMVVGVVIAAASGTLQLGAVLVQAFSPPSGVLFLLAIAGFVAMGVMAAKLDRRVAKHNWVEQLVNVFAQVMLLAGIIVF